MPLTLDEIRRERPRRAAEAEQRGGRGQRGARELQGVDHLRRDLLGRGIAELLERVAVANRLRDHGARREVELDAEGGQRAHDVGEHDRRVEREALERHQRDLGRERGVARERLEAVLLAERAVFGEISTGLAHDPERPARHGLAPDRLHQQSVACAAHSPVPSVSCGSAVKR